MRLEDQLVAARELVEENDLVLARYLLGPEALAGLLEAPRDARVELDDEGEEIDRFDGVPVVPDAGVEWFTIEVVTREGRRVHGHIAQALMEDWANRFGGGTRGRWGFAWHRDVKD